MCIASPKEYILLGCLGTIFYHIYHSWKKEYYFGRDPHKIPCCLLSLTVDSLSSSWCVLNKCVLKQETPFRIQFKQIVGVITDEELYRRRASQVAQLVKNPPTNAGDTEIEVRSLGQEDFPQRRKWQHTSVFLPGKLPWTEESGGPQSMGSQRVGHDWAYTQTLQVKFQNSLGILLLNCKTSGVPLYLSKSDSQFSRSVVSDSLQPHGLQRTNPSPTPGVYSNSSPLSLWCHPTISSSVVPFSSFWKIEKLKDSPFNLAQHEALFKWVSSLHQVAKVLEFQLQH